MEAGLPDAVEPTDDAQKTREQLLAELRAARGEIEALRHSRAQLARTLDRVADGVTVQDARGALVYANDAAARLCGYPSAEAFLAAPLSEIWRRFELLDDAGRPLSPDRLPGRLALGGDLNPPELSVCFRIAETGERR